MVEPASRQDVQNALDKARSNIMSSMLSRSDLQSVVNQVRTGLIQDIRSLHAENHVVMNQAANGRAQIMQRLGGLEHAVARMEQMMSQVLSQQSRTSTSIQSMKPSENAYLFQRV